MPHPKLTSKRQARLPLETCEAFGFEPGDVPDLEPRLENGERLGLLRPRAARSRAWVGSLAPVIAPVKSHSMAAIRRSITAGRRKGSLT